MVDPEIDAKGFQRIVYDDESKGIVNLSHADWKEEKPLSGEEAVDAGAGLVSTQDAAVTLLNIEGSNGGTIAVATEDENHEEEKIAYMIVENMRRNQMSYPRLTQLVRLMMECKTEVEKLKLFTCLCDDRHKIPTETLNEFWNMCTSAI